MLRSEKQVIWNAIWLTFIRCEKNLTTAPSLIFHCGNSLLFTSASHMEHWINSLWNSNYHDLVRVFLSLITITGCYSEQPAVCGEALISASSFSINRPRYFVPVAENWKSPFASSLSCNNARGLFMTHNPLLLQHEWMERIDAVPRVTKLMIIATGMNGWDRTMKEGEDESTFSFTSCWQAQPPTSSHLMDLLPP